jgi:hypothetical protein
MNRVLIALFSLLLLSLFAVPTFAQNNPPPTPGLGMYWLVDDNAWDGVWIRQGESNQFSARWSLDGEPDIVSNLTMTLDGNTVRIERVDPPGKWQVQYCNYTGEFQPDGVTIYGTVECLLTTDAIANLDWSATVVYGTPDISWSANASRYRAAKGSSFDFICQPDGSFFGLWGTSVYTDDSSICTAAAHAGLITPSNGGLVTLTILPGLDSYEGTQNNGVSSNSYGAWRASFSYGDGFVPVTPQLDWNATAVQYRGENGRQYTFECVARNGTRPVWGTDVYTDDSSICAAAVHAGAIGEAGGTVTIEIAPGQDKYKGSERNGIASRDWGSWTGSFIIR